MGVPFSKIAMRRQHHDCKRCGKVYRGGTSIAAHEVSCLIQSHFSKVSAYHTKAGHIAGVPLETLIGTQELNARSQDDSRAVDVSVSAKVA